MPTGAFLRVEWFLRQIVLRRFDVLRFLRLLETAMPKVQQNGNGGGRGRRARGARVSTSLAEINVVPLVDVMLVLLIIFMVTAPMMTQGLAVNLPQARRATPVTAQPLYVTIPAS